MTTIIHAADEGALRNGSFYSQRIGKQSSTIARYINGDFMGWHQIIPAGLRTWPLKAAKKLMPK